MGKPQVLDTLLEDFYVQRVAALQIEADLTRLMVHEKRYAGMDRRFQCAAQPPQSRIQAGPGFFLALITPEKPRQ